MIPNARNYFVYPDCIDGRKSFNGLTGIIRAELQLDPAGGDVFIFVSRSWHSIKLLFWEHGGFVIYYKRMDNGSFEVPALFGPMVRSGILVKFNCYRCCAALNSRKKNSVKERQTALVLEL